ncbi:LysM peptidoglycan-binding domain-containing protein [Microbacterium sp.]|uniref:LysM peptidoglycan-binding domain-containing protein n=1 Tax=Microbacterium sp. TaxID=51671 RepID=UPI00334225FD
MSTATARDRRLPLSLSAVVVGALAATLAATPAGAEEVPAARGDLRPAGGAASALRTPSAAKPTTHQVRQGDTVYGIAKKYGLRPADVLSWNGLTARSVIHPGQTLRLVPPAKAHAAPAAATGAVYVVAPGDTVYAIAKRSGTTVAAILSANGMNASSIIYPGQKLRLNAAPAAAPASSSAPASTAEAHTVRPGDTLFAIAKKYGTTVSALLAVNGLGASAIIYPGQTLDVRPPRSGGQRFTTLDATQTANARLIIRIGKQLGVSERGIAIALATAMVESGLRNLDHGDRDSLGLFQQRPSQGWGTAAQIRDADRSIRVFYGGRQDPNGAKSRGLLDIAGWQGMSFSGAAQAVQISDFPDRYGQWEQQAHRWLATIR